MCATLNPTSPDMAEIEAFEVYHWPIVRGYADRIGLVKVFNDLVPTRMEVEPGTIVLGMVLDTLSGRSPLYHLSRFFEGQDTQLLLGQSVAPGTFNEHNVARVLDLIYEKGTHRLFAEVAMAGVRAFNVPIKHVHFDTTSVTLHGDYESFDSEADGPHVAFGYSKDKRTDLKQFMQTLLNAGGGIPLLGKPENGNGTKPPTMIC